MTLARNATFALATNELLLGVPTPRATPGSSTRATRAAPTRTRAPGASRDPNGDPGVPGANGTDGSDGIDGTDGMPGDDGADGVGGYERLDADRQVPVGAEAAVSQKCPTGK